MSNAEQRIHQRLRGFERELDRLAQIADRNWYQGGMTWRAEYLKRKGKTSPVDGDLKSHFEQHLQQWAIFLWYIHGCPHHNEDLMGDISINLDDVSPFEAQARKMLEDICPKDGTEQSMLVIENDEDGQVSFELVFASGPNAMRVTGMWSVD
ncbi:hypothetical protein [Pseudophaeobacter sp. EL27]|uniref:hypothetical protein n=1 Tax=Pseudophaeobacter sp. EL27 TaxID=2107580 RepID=UPI0013C50BB4|nr:hypothetical protein [Pseudophaeobacter sp. EL27]